MLLENVRSEIVPAGFGRGFSDQQAVFLQWLLVEASGVRWRKASHPRQTHTEKESRLKNQEIVA